MLGLCVSVNQPFIDNDLITDALFLRDSLWRFAPWLWLTVLSIVRVTMWQIQVPHQQPSQCMKFKNQINIFSTCDILFFGLKIFFDSRYFRFFFKKILTRDIFLNCDILILTCDIL